MDRDDEMILMKRMIKYTKDSTDIDENNDINYIEDNIDENYDDAENDDNYIENDNINEKDDNFIEYDTYTDKKITLITLKITILMNK